MARGRPRCHSPATRCQAASGHVAGRGPELGSRTVVAVRGGWWLRPGTVGEGGPRPAAPRTAARGCAMGVRQAARQ